MDSSWRSASFRGDAAVFLPLLPGESGLSLLFEQRALHLDVQPGDICFPGGGVEEGENPEMCALRESMEELLVKEEQIRVRGILNPVRGPSGRKVWPVVGDLCDYEGSFSREEVDHTFSVPLRDLLAEDPEVYGVTSVTVPDEDFPFDRIRGGRKYPFSKSRREIYFYEWRGITIWGMTAGILHTFLEEVKAGKIHVLQGELV